MKKGTILLLLVLLTSYSCKTRKVETITETKIEYREVVRDTTVFVPADKATIKALLECDSLGNVYMKQIQTLQGKTSANANIIIKDNYITAECNCDSLSIYFTMKDRFFSSDKNTVETEIQYVEKELSAWQSLLQCFGMIFFGISIAFVIFCIFWILRKLKII